MDYKAAVVGSVMSSKAWQVIYFYVQTKTVMSSRAWQVFFIYEMWSRCSDAVVSPGTRSAYVLGKIFLLMIRPYGKFVSSVSAWLLP